MTRGSRRPTDGLLHGSREGDEPTGRRLDSSMMMNTTPTSTRDGFKLLHTFTRERCWIKAGKKWDNLLLLRPTDRATTVTCDEMSRLPIPVKKKAGYSRF